MDFQSLSRKELQILCKKNKIAANMTNVAMADALAALTNVEGIEEVGNSQAVLQSPQTCNESRRRPIKAAVASVDIEPNSSTTVTRTRLRTQSRGTQETGKENNDSVPTVLNENPIGSEVPITPALRTDKKRATRATSTYKKVEFRNDQEEIDSNPKDLTQNPSEVEMLKTPATRTGQRKATGVASSCKKVISGSKGDKMEDEKAKPVVTRAYSTRRSARIIQEPQVSETALKKKGKRAEALSISEPELDDLSEKPLSDEKDAIEDDKGASAEVSNVVTGSTSELVTDSMTAETINVESEKSLEGIQVADKVIVSDDISSTAVIAEVVVDINSFATQDNSNFNIEDTESNQGDILEKSNNLEGAETKASMEGIQVANKAEDVADAEVSSEVQDPAVDSLTKADDVADAEVSSEVQDPAVDSLTKAEDIADAEVQDPAMDSLTKPEDVADAEVSSEVQDPAVDSLTMLSASVEVLGSQPDFGLEYSISEKTTTSSEDEELGDNGENVVLLADTLNNVAEPVVYNSVPEPVVGVALRSTDSLGASSEDTKSDQDISGALFSGSVEVLGSQTDVGLEEATPDSEQFLTDGDNVAVSADICNEAKQAPSPVDDALSSESNRINLPADEASGGEMDQVVIPEDTSASVEVPDSLVSIALEKANNTNSGDIVIMGDASDITSADDNQLGAFDCVTDKIDVAKGDVAASTVIINTAAARTDQVMEIAFSSVITDSNVTPSPQVTASGSRRILNQNKKTPPVSKMVLKVFDEEEENKSDGLGSRNSSKSICEEKASKVGLMSVVDENKENDKGEEKMESSKGVEEKVLNGISLRKLKKMMKECLVNKEHNIRPALQTLPDNCLVEDGK